MNVMLTKFYTKLQDLMHREEGQDLVEYALLVSLIALAAVVASRSLGTGISTIFTNISTSIA